MPRPKVFIVRLSADDRERLTKVVSTGTHQAQMIRRAAAVELDGSAGPVDDRAVIAQRVGLSVETVRQIAKWLGGTAGDVQATIARAVATTGLLLASLRRARRRAASH